MNLLQHLRQVQSKAPARVLSAIAVGDRISRNLYGGSFRYEINDSELDRQLGEFGDENEFYQAVIDHFRPMDQGFSLIFPPSERREDGFTTPFSRAVELRFGDCLEKSIVVQMRQQRAGDSYLLQGHILAQGQSFPHAWNVVMYGKQPWLIDTQNTVISGGNQRTYVRPIQGVEDGILILPEPMPWDYLLKIDVP